MSAHLDAASDISLLLSARRATDMVAEAHDERLASTEWCWDWDRALAIRALKTYARPRLAKIARACAHRYDRIQYLHRQLSPPAPCGPWITTAPPSADGIWGIGAWPDLNDNNFDPARNLQPEDDEISPIAVIRPLPLECNAFP
ncbi:hypothetical protein B0H13DRAFT_2304188 [Mycena leptocephala]|nr:hypothetical protein B0H13DRAFT_2304188 [Mycena leptocephala]